MLREFGSKASYVFKNKHVILPVIHVESNNQALRNIEVARSCGSDGVFLINHGMSPEALLRIYNDSVREFPDEWIGLNLLGVGPSEVFRMVPDTADGVWVDDAGIDERQEDQDYAEEVWASKRESKFRGLYFGGVAFKYCRKVEDVQRAARFAGFYMDVVTTSGVATGKAADVSKIGAMKAVLGPRPLAVASGIAPYNIVKYLPFSDCYLVATHVSTSFFELCPSLLKSLVDTVRDYDGEVEKGSCLSFE